MKNSILFYCCVFFFAIILFNSCGKDEDDLLITKEEDISTVHEFEQSNPDVKDIDELFATTKLEEIKVSPDTDESKNYLLYDQVISLSKGNGKVLYLTSPKSYKKYWIEVIPTSGNVDAATAAWSPTRLINISTNSGTQVDAVHARGTDFKSTEQRLYFLALARTNTTFRLKIYWEFENDNCPVYGVPLHTQQHNFSCGQTCVRMVLDHYGNPPSFQQIYNYMGTTGVTNANQRAAALYAFGSRPVEVAKNCTFGRLKDRICLGAPAIVDIYAYGYGHSVVVTRISGSDRVYYNDPYFNNGGLKSLSKSEFMNAWVIPGTDSNGNPFAKNVAVFIN